MEPEVSFVKEGLTIKARQNPVDFTPPKRHDKILNTLIYCYGSFMPLLVGGKLVNESISAAISQLPPPKISAADKDFQLLRCVIIDAGEACLVEPGQQEMAATRKTSSCFQLYFSQPPKGLLVHFSSDFSLDLSQLLKTFDFNIPINLTLVGGAYAPATKATRNQVTLIKEIQVFCHNNPNMEINITHQLTGTAFMKNVSPFFNGGQIAQYPDVAFAEDGSLIDIQQFRPQSLKLLLPSNRKRQTHTHEAEHRAWLGRQLNISIPSAETLLIKKEGLTSCYQVFPHPIVLAFIDSLTEHGLIERYVDFITNGHYAGQEGSASANTYKQGLGSFLRDIENFSRELQANRKQYESAPDGPYSQELLAYLKDKNISSQYDAGISQLLTNLGFIEQPKP